jgi:signal transduction histidine kinase
VNFQQWFLRSPGDPGYPGRTHGRLHPLEWLPALVYAVAQPCLTAAFDNGRHRLGIAAHGARPLDLFALLLLAAAPLPLAWRLRRPTLSMVAVFAVSEVYLVIGYPVGPVWMAMIAAFISCLVRGSRSAAYLTVAAAYALAWIAHSHDGVDLSVHIGVLTWLVVLATIGDIIRARRRYLAAEAARREEAEAARQEARRRQAGEERLVIAQDLHDVLAHHISLITVQAGVGLQLFDRRPEKAREALSAVKQAGNTALSELRAVLEILRDPDSTAPRAPVPVLTRAQDFTLLLDAARGAGLSVLVQVGRLDRRLGTTAPTPSELSLPLLVDQAAYRIVQESLTNAIRHAGPGAAVSVLIDEQPTELLLRIEDDGRGKPGGLSGGGNGVPGMRARAAALGGVLTAGPRPGGGYTVRARLPLDGDHHHGRSGGGTATTAAAAAEPPDSGAAEGRVAA